MRITGELDRRLGAVGASIVANREELHSVVEVVVDARDVIIFDVREGGVEAEAGGVEGVASRSGEVIGHRIAIVDESEHILVETDAAGIVRGDLRGSQSGSRAAGVDIGDGAVAEAIHGDGALDEVGESIAAAVVIEEEEQLVSEDGAADVSAELVADEWRPGDACIVIEPVVRLEIGIAVVLDQGAVELIGAAASNEFVLSAAAFAGAG